MDKLKMGEFLLNQRKNRNLSQEDVSEIIGVTFQAVSKWERGEAIPDILTLEKLASLYNVTIDEIISGQKKESMSENSSSKINNNENVNSIKHEKQSRLYTTIFSSIYFIVFFISCFLPIVFGHIKFDDYIVTHLYAEFNYFNIIFSHSYGTGNFILMLHFITEISMLCFTILIIIFDTKKNVINMALIRRILIILNIILAILFWIIAGHVLTFVGICLLVLYLVLDVLYLVLPFNRKNYILKDFEK